MERIPWSPAMRRPQFFLTRMFAPVPCPSLAGRQVPRPRQVKGGDFLFSEFPVPYIRPVLLLFVIPSAARDLLFASPSTCHLRFLHPGWVRGIEGSRADAFSSSLAPARFLRPGWFCGTKRSACAVRPLPLRRLCGEISLFLASLF